MLSIYAMILNNKRENSRDSSSESNEPSTSSLLSGELIESSDESCPDSIYEEYLRARNYWNRRKAALAQKEILDRAYKFIYDEAFSNESTNESDFSVEYNKRREFWNLKSQRYRRESTMPAGDGNDSFNFKKPVRKYRSEKPHLSMPFKKQQGSKTYRENTKSRLSPRIFAKKLENFEESDPLSISSADNYDSNIDDGFGNPNRNIPLKKGLKNNRDTSMRRKRKLPKIEIQNRANNFEREKPADLTSRNTRWPKTKAVSKMRKTFPEQTLVADIRRRSSNQGNFIELKSSSSDDSFVIDVENVLQENLRGKNSSRLTVETVLLENTKNERDPILKSFRRRNPYRQRNTIDTNSNEVKLLGDIKKRIDQDFDHDSNEIEVVEIVESKWSIFHTESLEGLNHDEKSRDEVTNASSKSSRQYLVESIDSGVSTDFSRNESDLSRNFNYPEAEATRSSDIFNTITDDPIYLNSDAEDGEILDAKVEKAVQRFTEELIMCERRAVERGLIDGVKRSVERERRRRNKSFRKVGQELINLS